MAKHVGNGCDVVRNPKAVRKHKYCHQGNGHINRRDPAIEWVSSVNVAVALMAVFMFAHGFWITNYITSISEMFGQKATSTVVGLSGTAGAIAGLLLNPLMGVIIQQYSYRPLWIASGLLYPLAFSLLIILIPRIKALSLTDNQASTTPKVIQDY